MARLPAAACGFIDHEMSQDSDKKTPLPSSALEIGPERKMSCTLLTCGGSAVVEAELQQSFLSDMRRICWWFNDFLWCFYSQYLGDIWRFWRSLYKPVLLAGLRLFSESLCRRDVSKWRNLSKWRQLILLQLCAWVSWNVLSRYFHKYFLKIDNLRFSRLLLANYTGAMNFLDYVFGLFRSDSYCPATASCSGGACTASVDVSCACSGNSYDTSCTSKPPLHSQVQGQR